MIDGCAPPQIIHAYPNNPMEPLSRKPATTPSSGEPSAPFGLVPLRSPWRIRRVQTTSAPFGSASVLNTLAHHAALIEAQAWWSNPQDRLSEKNLQVALQHWGPWVAQLLDTFPVLAYALFHPGTVPMSVSSNRRERWEALRCHILRETSEGAKLKDLARLAGMPWSWRKFQLLVAPLVLRDPTPYTDTLIERWLPESPEAQYVWVLALRFVHRDPSRIHLEQALDFGLLTDWMARHAGTPGFVRHVVKRNNPKLLTRRVWSPIRDWLIAQCDPRHPAHNPELPRLHSRMTPAELAAAVKRWHARGAKTHVSNPGQPGNTLIRPVLPRTSTPTIGPLARPTSVPGMIFDDRWSIVAIAKARDLVREGEILQHCVARYSSAVKRGTKVFFSLRDAESRPQITIELGTKGESPGIKIVQASGLRNRQPNREERRRLRLWEEALNAEDLGRPVYFLEDERVRN